MLLLAVLGAGCSSTGGDATPDLAPTAGVADATSTSTTTCPEPPAYLPPLPDAMACTGYDPSVDAALVEALLAGDAADTSVGASSAPTRVLAVGDSILAEAHGYLVTLGAAHGLQVTVHAVGGTAPCDWVERLDAILTAVDPELIVFSFSGNAFTECMMDSPIGTAGFYDRYEQAATQLSERSVVAGGEVWWTEVLPFGGAESERQHGALNDVFSDGPHTMGLIPTRALFESDTGGFTTEGECRFPWEPCASLRIRADDGVHLGSDRSPYGPLRYAVSIVAFADCWRANRAQERAR